MEQVQKPSTNRHLLGVYGTLKFGGSNHRKYMSGAIYVKKHKISGILLDANGWYPCAILNDRVPDQHAAKPFIADHRISIEIYDVSQDELEHIDGLEGHPDYYMRTLVPVPVLGHVWVYSISPDWMLKGAQRLIPDGDWHVGIPSVDVNFGDGTTKPKVYPKKEPVITYVDPMADEDEEGDVSAIDVYNYLRYQSPPKVEQTEMLKIDSLPKVKEA